MEYKKTIIWTTEVTLRFIEAYQKEPCIWNPKDKFHKEKHRVNKAWQRIADYLLIPVQELKKKKESLMTAFRTNVKKKKASIRNGSGDDDIFQPTWIYFDAMEAFLADLYDYKSVLNTEEDEVYVVDEVDVGLETPDSGIQTQSQPTESEIANPTQNRSQSIKKPIIPMRKRRSKNPSELHKVRAKMDQAFSYLNEILSKNNNHDDECTVYGQLLGIKLKQFSPSLRNELMYEIDTLVMKKRQLLHHAQRNSTPSPNSSDSSYSSSYSENSIASPPRSDYSQQRIPYTHNLPRSQIVSSYNRELHDLLTITGEAVSVKEEETNCVISDD